MVPPGMMELDYARSKECQLRNLTHLTLSLAGISQFVDLVGPELHQLDTSGMRSSRS